MLIIFERSSEYYIGQVDQKTNSRRVEFGIIDPPGTPGIPCPNGSGKDSKYTKHYTGKCKSATDQIIFCNGGDRNQNNIPEMAVDGVSFKFGIGGDDKKNSSSLILKNWKFESEERLWGSFYNLFDSKDVKVKELVIKPKKGMSFQRHKERNEIWLISKGSCEVLYSKDNPESTIKKTLKKFDFFFISVGNWHQIVNTFEEDCHIIEIQYGKSVTEDDIERLHYYEDKNS